MITAFRVVKTDERRQEVQAMGQTIAEALREEGREEGRQQGEVRALQRTLANLLRKKFGRLPRSVERVIRGVADAGRLEAWVVQAGTASSLEEIGIEPGSKSASPVIPRK